MIPIPELRLRALNARPVRKDGEFVLYWMTANRRTRWNFALDRALGWAQTLGRPLVILEALRADYRWNSARLHRFVLDGMADNAVALAATHAHYHPYVEPRVGDGHGLVAALSERACVVVTDDFPCFFLPRMTEVAATRGSSLFESVDSNGILPMRATDDVFPTAYAFRRFLQKSVRPHLARFPSSAPFDDAKLVVGAGLPHAIESRWPRASTELLEGRTGLDALPVDALVRPTATHGGASAAEAALDRFVRHRLPRYAADRSEPEKDAASGLSPYLHFGHVSAHAVFEALARWEGWTSAQLGSATAGKKAGFWGMGESAEAFLDELVTWRELGYNFASKRADYDRYESLPDWSRATLAKHSVDRREHVYSLEQLAAAATHDPLWNAAQTELVRDGRIHNYLRMLWGKKILQWSATPQAALDAMIELNNRYALDGRDPNSYSGIFWVLGRYDRPWGPERPIFGTVRYMTSENTARKMDVDGYIRRFASAEPASAASPTSAR